MLDRVDGLLARARRTVTPFGTWLDVTADRLREAAVVIGLGGRGRRVLDATMGVWPVPFSRLLTLSHLAAASSRTARGLGWGTDAGAAAARSARRTVRCRQVPPPAGRPLPAWLAVQHLARRRCMLAAIVGLIVLSPPDVLLLVLAVLAGAECGGVSAAGRARRAPCRPRSDSSSRWPTQDLWRWSSVVRIHSCRYCDGCRNTGRGVGSPSDVGHRGGGRLLVVTAWADADALPVTLAWVGVLSFHRIDVATRLRVLGTPPPQWLDVLGLGALGRVVFVALCAAAAGSHAGAGRWRSRARVVFATESSGVSPSARRPLGDASARDVADVLVALTNTIVGRRLLDDDLVDARPVLADDDLERRTETGPLDPRRHAQRGRQGACGVYAAFVVGVVAHDGRQEVAAFGVGDAHDL